MFVGEKNDEFSFLAKLMPKLVCLTNAVVLDSVFSFDSRQRHLSLLFLPCLLSPNFIIGIITSLIAAVMDSKI